MELDKALGFAVILGWDDLKKVSDPCSARVEYRSAIGTAVNYLSIWSVDAEGRQSKVCDYWTWTSPAHTTGIGFKNKFQSHLLGLALDFILMNQDQFTRPAGAAPEGLALVYPPSADDLAEATTWMGHVHGAATNVSRAENEKAVGASPALQGALGQATLKTAGGRSPIKRHDCSLICIVLIQFVPRGDPR